MHKYRSGGKRWGWVLLASLITACGPKMTTPLAHTAALPTAVTPTALAPATAPPATRVSAPPTDELGLIAFYSDRDGNPEIYTLVVGGTDPVRLTDDAAFDDSPAISPDGGRIAFLTARHDPDPQFPNLKYELYVMDSDGGNARRLTTTEAAEGHPAWSPDGTRLSFDADYDADGYSEIYTITPEGASLVRLTFNAANDQFADWSPDGAHLAFASDRNGNWDIFVMDADGSNQHPLTDSPIWELFPAWSPDGAYLAFTGLVAGSRDTDVFGMRSDGSDLRQLTTSPGFDENPAWSPDGRLIAFQTQRDGNFELYVMNPDGSEQRPLAPHRADELWPSWVTVAP